MNPSTSNFSSVGNALIKVTTLIAIVMAAVMVAAGVYGEVALHRGQVTQPPATTHSFNPCDVDHWGREFPIQVKEQFRKQCVEHSVR